MEIISIKKSGQGTPFVSARDLHFFLDVNSKFFDWMKRMFDYGFAENVDYAILTQKKVKLNAGRPKVDFALKLNMAKEICMISKTPKGKEAREYFIKCEEALIQASVPAQQKIPQTLAEALRLAADLADENEAQKEKIAADAPKVLFAEAVTASDDSILIGQLAKILKQKGSDTGQNRLFAWLRDEGYLCKTGHNYNMPTQKAMDLKLFELTERVIQSPDKESRITLTTKVTGKGQQYFVNKILL